MIKTEAMENNTRMIELLIERTVEYGKTSFELARLKALDKASDVVSSWVAHYVVMVFIIVFMLFLNLGLALWLGEILGNIYFGFFVIAAFYGITGIFIHFFMHKWIKKLVRNNFIKQVLK